MLQLVQHVTTPALFGGMTDVVQRRPSKNRFAWFLGAEKNVPTQPGKLSKAPSRRGIVSGPRKMGQQRASSMDGPDFKDASIVASEASLVTPLSTKASELAFRERLDGNANVGKKQSFVNEYAFSRPPAWATKSGEWSVIAVPDHPRYEIHEPVGPTWYINHHLRPPPTAHPRTSFPPTPYVGNSQTQSSGSSSAASKPTRPRQYNDIVDSLDVSDPHGARWHHASPYELPRAASTRPKSQFVGPGVGTYAGPIEGSEPVEATYAAFAHTSPLTPPSGGRLSKSRNSSHTRLVAPSPLSQSHSADDVGTRPHANVVPGVPISLDDPVTSPPSNFTANSSTSSLPTIQPSRTRPESPLKSSTSPGTPNTSSVPRKPPPVEPTHDTPETLPSAPAQIESSNVDTVSALNQQKPTPTSQPMPSAHKRKRSLSASASPSSRDNGLGGLFRSRRASNQTPTASASSSSQPTPTSISGPSPLKPPSTKPPTSGLGRSASTDKGAKRGSILGRLVKRFSTSRKIDAPVDSVDVKSYQSALRDSPIPEDITAQPPSAHITASAPATIASAPSSFNDIRPGLSPSMRFLVQKEIEMAQASDIRNDLPHHIPTPKVFSPLILHAPMPPSSPSPADAHLIGGLMIANPDIWPSPSPPKLNRPSVPAPHPPTSPPLPDLPTVTPPTLISSPIPVRPTTISILNSRDAEQLPERKDMLDRRTSYDRHSTVPTASGRVPPPFPVLSTVTVTQTQSQEREEHAESTPRRSRESPSGIEGPPKRQVTSPPSHPPGSSVFPSSRPPEQRESVSIPTALDPVPDRPESSSNTESVPVSRRPENSSPTKESSSGREDHRHRDGHHRSNRERERRVEHDGDRSAHRSKAQDHDQNYKTGSDKEKDQDHMRDRERRHHKDREHRRHRYEGEKDRERIRKRRSKDRHRGESPNKATRSSEDRERRRHGEVTSDSTPPLTIHPPVEARSSRGSHIFPQASPVPAHGSTPPPQGSRSSPTRRRQPSTETIQALGKEWEIVPDDSISQRRVSRSKRRRSTDKAAAVPASAPSSSGSGSLASGLVQKSRSIVRMRRSLSADSSLTSKSRPAPTPPPKGQAAKPPTSGSHPPSARRQSTTPPPRGKSPSSQPSRPVISGPSPIGGTRSRKNSAASVNLRSSSSRPPANGQAIKPSISNKAMRPQQEINSSSSVPGSSHPKSVSHEDLPVTRRRRGSTEVSGEVSDVDGRRRRGQSWSAAQALEVMQYPRSQPYPPSHSDGPANNGAGNSSYRSDPDPTTPRAGSSHTSFSMQAHMELFSVGRNQLPSSPQQISPLVVASDFYGRAVQQYQPANSPYSNPHPPSSGYDPRTGLSSSPPNTLPPGYPASSSLTNLSQSALVSSLSEGPTLVQFSSRAPYPIAAYGQQRSSTSWGSPS